MSLGRYVGVYVCGYVLCGYVNMYTNIGVQYAQFFKYTEASAVQIYKTISCRRG